MTKEQSFEDRMKEKFGENTVVIERDEKFLFSCEACGECCKNRNGHDSIILTAYDVFNLCKNLNMDFVELVNKHVNLHIGSNSGLPMTTLDDKTSLLTGENMCTFLRKMNGSYKCMVHDFKPVVCAIYPLGRVVTIDQKVENKDENLKKVDYLFLGSDCQNKRKVNKDMNTLNSWVNDIDVTEKIFIDNAKVITDLLEIANFRNIFDSKKLPQKAKDMFEGVYIKLTYAQYDYSKDFLPQYENNMKILKDLLKGLVSIHKREDESIVSKWKDFYTDEELADVLINTIKTLGI